MRKLQIGVMGSMADLGYSEQAERMAADVGSRIAELGAVVVYGAEKDSDSLSTTAARSARASGGLAVGVTYGKGLDVWQDCADIVIASGMERGGGREFTLALSCDAMIAISGGSGTLNEITIAYQAGIPIVAIPDFGGWSNRLVDQYLDERKRLKIEMANGAAEAVEKAIELAGKTV